MVSVKYIICYLCVSENKSQSGETIYVRAVILNLFHCWDPLNTTDVVWDPQVKTEKKYALRNKVYSKCGE